MSKGKMEMFTCPGCGWTVKTPFGENDIPEHSMMHAKKHHRTFTDLLLEIT